MQEISEIVQNKEFCGLKDEWNALLEQSGADTMFLTWEWLYSWWQVYGAGKTLSIIVIKEDGELKAIAPLFQNSLLGKRSLQFIGSYGVGSDYLDFILYPEREEELLNKILSYLESHRNTWDVLSISDIPEGSKSTEVIKRHPAFYTLQKKHTTCPYLKLPATWDDLVSGFSSNMRYDLNRKHRRFEKEPKARFFAITDKELLGQAWSTFVMLNSKRMTEKDISAPFADGSFNAFHAAVIPLLFEKGMLRLYILEVGSPIGCIYIMKYRGKFYFYQIGFDPEWNKLSPGMLLFRYSIEQAISEGVTEFDFLQGDEEYKFRWTKDIRYNDRFFIFSKSIKNIPLMLLVRLILTAQDWKKTLVRKVKEVNKEIRMRSRNLKPSPSAG